MTDHSNIVRGLLRSHNILQDISQVPCNVINTLETDVDAAKNFVTQLEQGQTPNLIQNLSPELIGTFHDLINIASSLPTEILDTAQAAVTDVVSVFDDIENGSIVSDLENVPGIVISDITAGWGGFTHGVVAVWAGATSEIAGAASAIDCAFGSCPPATATTLGSCASAAGNNTQTYTPANTTPAAASSASVFAAAAASRANTSSEAQATTTKPGKTGGATSAPFANATAPAQSNVAGGGHGAPVWAVAVLGVLGFFVCGL